MAAPESKTCLVCKQSHPIDQFHRDKSRKDGRFPYCRDCARAQGKSRRASAEWKAHKKDYDRQRYAENRETIIAKVRSWYEANPERVKRRAKEWTERHPERRKLVSQSYKHRRRTVEGVGMSWRELRQWKDAQRKVCHWCGTKCPDSYTVDHIVPLARGGKHEARNLVIACRPCNGRKHARDPLEWARMMGKLL